MNSHNVFAGAFVDRSGHRRDDEEWLTTALSAPETRFVPVWRGKCLVSGEPPRIELLEHRHVDAFVSPAESIFLGLFEGRPAFAFEMESEDSPFEGTGEFHDLRYLGTILPAAEANLVAHAIALVNWHHKQRFCSACGEQAAADRGGNTRSCIACGQQYFPRVDPAIIVLVSDGDRALLGRQPTWPEGRYSTIAGFVEPGESLEDAVRREVLEETDIKVDDIRYHSSQPWPFPSSLMLGFTAVATSTDIRLNDGELEDAQWFTRKECRSGFPKLPFRLSIARRLVDHWLQDE